MGRLRSARGACGILVVLIALTTLASPGCGYSLAGRGSFLPAYIQRIGVPLFVNHTPVYDIERKLTDRVRGELAGRGKYKVDPVDTGVDAVLTGEITAITLVPAAFTDQQQASRYILTLVAKIEFKDMKTTKVLWANPALQFREEYDVTNTATLDPNAFLGQDANALERLAGEFARSVVSAILEAF
jgi:lipopolysaccharide assembly LptE-like protein